MGSKRCDHEKIGFGCVSFVDQKINGPVSNKVSLVDSLVQDQFLTIVGKDRTIIVHFHHSHPMIKSFWNVTGTFITVHVFSHQGRFIAKVLQMGDKGFLFKTRVPKLFPRATLVSGIVQVSIVVNFSIVTVLTAQNGRPARTA